MQPAWLLHSYHSGDVMEYFNYQLSLLAPSMRSVPIMEPKLSPSDHTSTNKGPLPQKRAKQSNKKLFQEMFSHLQLCTTLDRQLWTDNFGQLHFNSLLHLYFHTKPHLLIQIVCTRKVQTLHMRTPSKGSDETATCDYQQPALNKMIESTKFWAQYTSCL